MMPSGPVSVASLPWITSVDPISASQVPEAERKAREEANKKAEEEARQKTEKRKPLEDRLRAQERLLLAVLESLEKIDPPAVSDLGLDKERLAKTKVALARRIKVGWTSPQETFQPIGPAISPLK